MFNELRFRHRPDDIPATHLRTRRQRWRELPTFTAVERCSRAAAMDEVAHLRRERLQRALDAVEDRAEEAGPQLDRERRARGIERRARLEAGGVFVDLHGGAVLDQADDLAHEALTPHPEQLRHAEGPRR